MLDWNTLIPQILTALPGTIAAIGTLIVAIGNRKRSNVRDGKIEEIHQATNGMKDDLVEAVRTSAIQQGHTAGVKDEKVAEADRVRRML